VRHDCGCVIEPDPASGVLRSVEKCRRHSSRARDPETLDAAYYAELGTAGDATDPPHLAELAEALGAFPAGRGRIALEVGCGASHYVPGLQATGWAYLGLDASPWAAGWTARRHGVAGLASTLEAAAFAPRSFGLILAAHCLEHLLDAPGAIRRCAELLAPDGELWIVVPDDTDQFNPDHLWFFTQATLRACVESAGLTVLREAAHRRVPYELFLYLRARKP
jgi:SAM-dependent methyltransferase